MNTIFIIGIFLTFFLQFLLLTRKNKSLPDRILGIWMFVIGLHLFSYYIYHLGYWDKYPHLTGITHPFPLLHGPFLYLYVVFSVRKDQHFRPKDFLHFTPALLSYLYMIPYFFFYSVEKKRMVDSGELSDYRVFMLLSLFGFIVSGITYAVLAFRLTKKLDEVIHDNFSYDEKINLNWLRYCILGMFGVFLTVGILSALQYLFKIQLPFNPDMVYYSEVILFIFFVGYFGIRHEGIFSENPESETTPSQPNTGNKPAGEYKKSGLKADEASQLNQRLLALMDEKQYYLEPKLTLSTLANELTVSANYLSQLINQCHNKNFYDFINEYRVEEFKKQASSPKNQHLSLLAIALDSGFNSKSSFNMVFKKHTGETPSQFLVNLKKTEN